MQRRASFLLCVKHTVFVDLIASDTCTSINNMSLHFATSLRGFQACRAPISFSSPYNIAIRRKTDSKQRNHYETLGVSAKATPKEIKAAFFALSKKHHPDLNSGNAEKFVEIKEAYTLLMNEKKRREYDLNIERPFATRETYSSHPPHRATGNRTGRPTGGQVRRPLRTRMGGEDVSGSGQFTGFESDEKRWRAYRAAREMRRNAEGDAPHFAEWQREQEVEGWRRVIPNNPYAQQQRSFNQSNVQATRTAGLLLAVVVFFSFFMAMGKSAPSEDTNKSPASTASPIPDYHPRPPGADSSQAKGTALSLRQLNEERRIQELQREKLRIEMLLKASSESSPATVPKDI
eukprot:scpid78533/ scgid4110/ Chaperone protein DnaJ